MFERATAPPHGLRARWAASAAAPSSGWWWRNGVVVPAVFAIAALVCKTSGFDDTLASAIFDPARAQFWARDSTVMELVGHRLAKSAVFACWFVLVGIALAASWIPPLRRRRRLLWTTALAMASGPLLVVALKSLNATQCPWDLKQFGGIAERASGWFVAAADAGRCFPSGHAAGGFSLVALSFAGAVAGWPRLRTAGLVLALGAGFAFSAVRVLQGAHFASHNLWSAAIDWAAAALVFALLTAPSPPRRPAAPSLPNRRIPSCPSPSKPLKSPASCGAPR